MSNTDVDLTPAFNKIDSFFDSVSETFNNLSEHAQNLIPIGSLAIGLATAGTVGYGICQIPGLTDVFAQTMGVPGGIFMAPLVVGVPAGVSGLLSTVASTAGMTAIADMFTPDAPA